ncbi:MAG TPA: TonB family protein [Bryobacteraceae bacterium]|nr:TonB family protein [Bryobacteraceae bacterium]
MKAFLAGLLGFFALANAAFAADAEGCTDLKVASRLEGCVIQECSGRQHDSFEVADSATGSIDATVNALTYVCPKPMDLARVKRDLEAKMRKAGYLSAPDKSANDPANPVGLAHKGSEWLRWSATEEDGSVQYTLASAGAGQSVEACSRPPVVASLQQCQVVECTSKGEDSVAMKTSQRGQASLTGNVQTFMLSCPAQQASSGVESELRSSGFEILFHDGGEMTVRSGKRWVSLASAAEGESVSYAITVVPSAEVLTAAVVDRATNEPTPAAAEPAPATVAITPSPDPAPKPEAESAAVPTPEVESASSAAPSTPPHPEFIAPKPVTEVQIEATHDRIYSVMGNVTISLLVDVDADGAVTRAELTGRITKDVRKLEGAAIEAVYRWRFEPARQDGRAVPAVKIPVEMHFHGHPWQF